MPAQIDKSDSRFDDTEMDFVTKEMLDARLETIETRMDGRLATFETKMEVKFAELKSEMHKSTAELIKWVLGTALTTAAVAITVMTFVLNNAVPKSPVPSASQMPPIVVYAQPAPPAPKTPSDK
nr:hypothetical protein [uncultured Duganella sp.]